jgi:hypothetical protein
MKCEIYTRNFRVLPAAVFGLVIGVRKHEHFRDRYPHCRRPGSSWKLCLLIACFEVHIMLWKAKDEERMD